MQHSCAREDHTQRVASSYTVKPNGKPETAGHCSHTVSQSHNTHFYWDTTLAHSLRKATETDKKSVTANNNARIKL